MLQQEIDRSCIHVNKFRMHAVFADSGATPVHLKFFRVQLTIPDLNRKEREGLIRAVKSCLVHNTLRMSPVIDIEVSVAHAGEELVVAG